MPCEGLPPRHDDPESKLDIGAYCIKSLGRCARGCSQILNVADSGTPTGRRSGTGTARSVPRRICRSRARGLCSCAARASIHPTSANVSMESRCIISKSGSRVPISPSASASRSDEGGGHRRAQPSERRSDAERRRHRPDEGTDRDWQTAQDPGDRPPRSVQARFGGWNVRLHPQPRGSVVRMTSWHIAWRLWYNVRQEGGRQCFIRI